MHVHVCLPLPAAMSKDTMGRLPFPAPQWRAVLPEKSVHSTLVSD